MSRINFVLSWVEYEKSFIISGPDWKPWRQISWDKVHLPFEVTTGSEDIVPRLESAVPWPTHWVSLCLVADWCIDEPTDSQEDTAGSRLEEMTLVVSGLEEVKPCLQTPRSCLDELIEELDDSVALDETKELPVVLIEMTAFLAIEGMVETNALALDIIAEFPMLNETVESTLLVLGEITEFLMFGGTDETTVQVLDESEVFPDEVVDTIELALEEITEFWAWEGRCVDEERLKPDDVFSNLICSEVELSIFSVSFQ